MGSAKIGTTMNGVAVNYDARADNEVDDALVSLLRAVIKPSIAAGHTLKSVWVSTTTNGKHAKDSRHYSGKAVDISRINSLKMSVSYPSDATVKAIVDAIQAEADAQKGTRENFGPARNHKHGKPWTVGGHKDHIHLSVD